jgi:hypothetical protein
MRRSITKIAVAGVFIALPIAGVTVPAYATPGIANAPAVLPAPLPADPPTDAPAPPAPPPAPAPIGQEYNANNDWWAYGSSGDAGGGGGGGGG